MKSLNFLSFLVFIKFCPSPNDVLLKKLNVNVAWLFLQVASHSLLESYCQGWLKGLKIGQHVLGC